MAGGIRAFVRKRAMIYLWRAQQSGAIISITLLGTLTAASLFDQYIREATNNYWVLGDSVLAGVIVTMALIFTGVFGVGFAFDRLKFWKEQNIVAIERNPYGSYKLTAKEIYWIRIWTAAVAAAKQTDEQEKVITLFNQWIERSTLEDPILKAEVAAIERWIVAGDERIKQMLEQGPTEPPTA